MKSLIIPFFILITFASFAQDHKQKYEQKIKQLIDKQDRLQQYYTIDENGISIFATPADQAANKIEYRLGWSELSQFKALMREVPLKDMVKIMSDKKEKGFSPEAIEKFIKPPAATGITPEPGKPLKGLKVAIDPGHIAGDMETARLEKKFLDMKPDSSGKLSQPVQIAEGKLTLHTALLLKHSLEQAGAVVMMTRSKPNETAFGKTFDEWIKKDLPAYADSMQRAARMTAEQRAALLKSPKRDLFRKVFFELELQERARKINAFKPDLTVIVHYNVDETNTAWKQPTVKNFNMAFVPGSFMKNEMSSREARLEFLRLVVTDDIESSIQLSSLAVKAFEDDLKVPAAGERDAKYLYEACMVTPAKGVFARNLTLTRLVHGPLVYGETLYQDNINECLALQRTDAQWNDLATSSRIKQVADAYFKAIVKYAGRMH